MVAYCKVFPVASYTSLSRDYRLYKVLFSDGSTGFYKHSNAQFKPKLNRLYIGFIDFYCGSILFI